MNGYTVYLRMPLRHVVVAFFVLALGCGTLAAQRFQDLYGSTAVDDAGLHGVKQLTGGGYVAVGESSAGGPDAMVVVTTITGATSWANTYQIGTASHATDVVQDPGSGDLIICGYTTAPVQPCSTAANDIFILRIDLSGTIVKAATYNCPGADEEAWKIIQTQVGGGGVNAGDFVVAGSTRSPAATGKRDGYLLRVDGSLLLLWDRQYGATTDDDYFYGVAEVPPGQNGAGDIVGAGGSTGYTSLADVFLVRASGLNGTIGAPPQNVSWTDLSLNLDDEAHSVVVLNTGANAGDIVVAGYSDGFGSNPQEALVLEFGADPCNYVAGVYFGDNSAVDDRAMDLVEDLATGDVVATGFTVPPAGSGFGNRDVFLQRISTGATMALVGTPTLYGGRGDDEGWSLAQATNTGSGETKGYIINGITKSRGLVGTNLGQLYLIKTDVNFDGKCNFVSSTFTSATPTIQIKCAQIPQTSTGSQCTPNVGSVSTAGTQLCYAFPKPSVGEGTENSVLLTFNEGHVSAYPNPVEGGSDLRLRFDLNEAATVGILVSDMTGRAVYRADPSYARGAAILAIPTEGWPAGSYITCVTIGKASSSVGVVVLEK